MLRNAFHRLPSIKRRDAELKALRDERSRPSFFYKRREAARIRKLGTEGDAPAPVWTLDDKAAGYRFAQSHGVPIPAIYGEYDQATEIDWARLPEEFVVKANSSTMSRGVLPLQRKAGGYLDLLDAGETIKSMEEVVRWLEELHFQKKASSELLVEELLHADSAVGLRLPPDYKLFCFNGVVGLIMVVGRRWRDKGGASVRYFSPEGADLGDVRPRSSVDHMLPRPIHLTELITAGETLSAAIMSPFVRVDMYDGQKGVMFGEITPAPGGNHVFRKDVDTHLGELWEQAQARLEQAAIVSGIREPVFGPHDCRELVDGGM